MTDTPSAALIERLKEAAERVLLRHMAGKDVSGLQWGAAMSEGIESLKGRGYVRVAQVAFGASRYFLTAGGRAAMEATDE